MSKAGGKLYGPSGDRRDSQVARIKLVAAIGASVLAGAGLAGSALHIAVLQRMHPSFPAMMPMTALALILASVALQSAGSGRSIRAACATATALIGAIGLLFDLIWIGLEHPPIAGLPSPYTATCLVLLGVALLLVDMGRESRVPPSQYFAIGSLVIASLALVGYIYGVGALYSLDRTTGMAIHTVAAILMLSTGILAAQPRSGIIRMLSASTTGAWLARRLIPPVLILPLLLDAIARAGARAGLYPERLVVPADIVLSAGAIITIILATARILDRVDLSRLAAEQDLTLAMRDIGVRRRVEEQMRLQTTAIDAAHNGVVITDIDGIIRWVNPAFTRLTGFSAPEAVGRKTNMLRSGHHDQQFYRDLWQTISDGRHWHGEIVNRRKDGSIYTEEQTIAPVRGPDGQITHFIGIKQDVTARRQAEADRERLIAELQDALADVKRLSGLLPICSSCKKIRDDEGYWSQIESYISRHSGAKFSHGICPDCFAKLYPEFVGRVQVQPR